MDANTMALLKGQASQLAVRGMRNAALELLGGLPETEGAALRARIYCQQGRLKEAVRFWKAALAANPEDEGAKRGLLLAERLAKSPFGRMRLHARRLAMGLVFAIVSCLVVWRVAAIPHNRSFDSGLNERLTRLEQEIISADARSHTDIEGLAQVVGRQQSAKGQSQEQLRVQLQRLQQTMRRLEKKIEENPKY